MNRVETALRSFFWILFNKRFASTVGAFFTDTEQAEKKTTEIPPPQHRETYSEAIQLIAAFQRDGRLVDFLMESIDAYSDAQIGAAVRDVHRDCRSVLDRVFLPQSISQHDEGNSISIQPGFDPSQYRFSGNVAGNPPYDGVIRHKGWKATRVELPQWQGSQEAAVVIAPVEVELP